MRTIFAGIEYAGKSTLIQLLDQYYRHRKCPTHTDDHFTIPDASLSPASQALMVGFPDDVKERMQRMQIHYHVEVIKNYANTLISGWHLEEAVYSSMYGKDPGSTYYPNYGYRFQRLYESLVLEARLPDIVLVHLRASDEAIRQRMQAHPHRYQIIKEKDIARLKQLFAEEIDKSLFTHKGYTITLDTTGKTPQESLDELLLLSEPRISAGELALRALPVPAGEYEVKYEGGVRRTVPKA
ncbi:MAG: hypothetical protein HYW07_04375 [Candidatus Latescibacteria bacterium]|nr:hypothetical protein [Candidatus Latescibacterota bacterium]